MVKTPVAVKKSAGPPKILFGTCRGEDLSHARCRGAILQNQTLVVCSCPSHEGEPGRCINCGIQNDMVDLATRHCTDPEGCVERVETKRRNNPLHTMLQEVQQVAQATKAAKAPAKAKAEPKAPRVARAKVGRCQHCGEPTKGGLFVPGHDAKLKGQLAKIVETTTGESVKRKADRVTAAAEMIVRGWVKKALPDEIAPDALAMVEKSKLSEAEFAAKLSERRMP